MKLEVAAGVVEKEGKYLVGCKIDVQSDSEVWEFPGGKVEAGESIEKAIRREWMEELEVELTEYRGLIATMENEQYRIYFCAVEISQTPAAKEHRELSWLEPELIAQLPMHSLDSEFASRYLL